MSIYFIRHGESEANVKQLFAGQKEDSPLTEHGLQQARDAVADLSTVRIDQIYCSPLLRAHQTAQEVAKGIGYNPEAIVVDQRLAEYDMGSLTGTPLHAISSQELVTAEGAENVHDFCARIRSFLQEHKTDSSNMLIASHAGVGRAIEAMRQGIAPEEFYSIAPYPNAHVIKLDLGWL
ncbi:MAG TPA: histidine phosphatase family protein [Candidatus Saccharimonadales bacterium]|nr:histidine phosphatase family protein [Candidatus Saccharimonadales bacterium]